jgi:hypothetical protein
MRLVEAFKGNIMPSQTMNVRVQGTCADCGRPTSEQARFMDLHTHSEVELCAGCIPAFLHRQQFPSGCCG